MLASPAVFSRSTMTSSISYCSENDSLEKSATSAPRTAAVKSIAASGALGDLGCHGLDLVSFVTGQQYTSVVSHL
ncbi:MAG: hypothetical protein IJC63_08245, partial [Myxococcaceae bacterium]|nr:hypothetical protein [Myxococcaceae bacterium]